MASKGIDWLGWHFKEFEFNYRHLIPKESTQLKQIINVHTNEVLLTTDNSEYITALLEKFSDIRPCPFGHIGYIVAHHMKGDDKDSFVLDVWMDRETQEDFKTFYAMQSLTLKD